MEYSLQNIHITQAQAMAEEKGAKQLVICKTRRGVNYVSNWDIKEVLEFLKMKVEEEEAMRKTWLPDQSRIPKLPLAMEEIMKKPNLVKTVATKALKAFLIPGNHKMGKGSFPAWRFPVEKAYFINTSTLLHQLPDIFTLSDIIDWGALDGATISNGPTGGASAIKSASGVKTWLAFVKILLEFLYLVEGGGSPASQLEAQSVRSAGEVVEGGTPASWLDGRGTSPGSVMVGRSSRVPSTLDTTSTNSIFKRTLSQSRGKSLSMVTSTPEPNIQMKGKRIRKDKLKPMDLFQAEEDLFTSPIIREPARRQVTGSPPTTDRTGDFEMGLALSVSLELERRKSGDMMVSTQEYQEDERRRTELLNDNELEAQQDYMIFKSKDMFETTYEDFEELPASQCKTVGVRLDEESERENIELQSETTDEENEEMPASQYKPYMVRMEEEREKEKRKLKKEIEQKESDENTSNDTMKLRWCGQSEQLMPESRSKHVGVRPRPTIIVRRAYHTVDESKSPNRIIHSFTKMPSFSR